jgi:signal transduction histidine kinase
MTETVRIFVRTTAQASRPAHRKRSSAGSRSSIPRISAARAEPGLGMNISREIVEAMGGTIDYESELGKGSTFFVDLPRVKADPVEAPPAPDAVVVHLPKAANG